MERLQFVKPDVVDRGILKFLLENAGDVSEAFRAYREAEAVKVEIQNLRTSPRTLSESVEILQDRSAETMTMIENWLRVCINSVAKGATVPARRLEHLTGEILLGLFSDKLPALAEEMVEIDDAVERGVRESRMDTLQKKLARLQGKVEKLVPESFRNEDLGRSRLAEIISAWRSMQALTNVPIDPFGTTLPDSNPFSKIYDVLGIGTAIAPQAKYEANNFANLREFYTDF